MNLENDHQVALITGGSRGIGRAICLTLAKKGIHLVVVGRDPGKLNETKKLCEEYGVKVLTLAGDLTQQDFVKEIIPQTINSFGSLNYLVNNAGCSPNSNDLEEWDQVLDLNFRSVYYLTKYAVPELLKSKNSAVINIVSISAKMTYKNGGIYCSSKHALAAYTACLFDDLREDGVKVTSIFPGFVNTELVTGDNINRSKMIQPEDIGYTVSFIIDFPNTSCPTEITIRPQRTPIS